MRASSKPSITLNFVELGSLYNLLYNFMLTNITLLKTFEALVLIHKSHEKLIIKQTIKLNIKIIKQLSIKFKYFLC